MVRSASRTAINSRWACIETPCCRSVWQWRRTSSWRPSWNGIARRTSLMRLVKLQQRIINACPKELFKYTWHTCTISASRQVIVSCLVISASIGLATPPWAKQQPQIDVLWSNAASSPHPEHVAHHRKSRVNQPERQLESLWTWLRRGFRRLQSHFVRNSLLDRYLRILSSTW